MDHRDGGLVNKTKSKGSQDLFMAGLMSSLEMIKHQMCELPVYIL